jgi:hypothetical protein
MEGGLRGCAARESGALSETDVAPNLGDFSRLVDRRALDYFLAS